MGHETDSVHVDSVAADRTTDDWETPDTQLVNYKFGDDMVMTWESQSCIRGPLTHQSGVTFSVIRAMVIGGGNEYDVYDLMENS